MPRDALRRVLESRATVRVSAGSFCGWTVPSLCRCGALKGDVSGREEREIFEFHGWATIRVYVLAHGAFAERPDPFMSPFIPVVENPYSES